MLQTQRIKYFLYASPQLIQLIGLCNAHHRQGRRQCIWGPLTMNFATALSPLVRVPSLALAK